MEFFLVPLFAIAGVTFGIYKVAGLIFHIRLSWGLLAMLVGFAWLISLVLPAVFYHSAGFMGSVGISLVCAAGFAWMATLYDAKNRMAQLAANGSDLPQLQENAWTPAAETASPVIRNLPDIETESESIVQVVPEPNLQEPAAEEQPEALTGLGGSLAVDKPIADVREYEEPVLPEPQVAREITEPVLEPVIFSSILEEAIDHYGFVEESSVDSELLHETSNISEVASAEVSAENESAVEDLLMQREPLEEPEPLAVSEPQEELPIMDSPQPVSNSLADLLEFAFEQRNCRNLSGALAAFRQIRRQYDGSDAVPLVEAEMVSTLQSCGDYAGALAELTLALELPMVCSDNRLTRIFEQKRAYLAALQDLLREHGKPNLPFEQIPAEWSDWLEGKISAEAGAQS